MAYAFTMLDASGDTVSLQAGSPFTTYWVVEAGQQTAQQINHPWTALDVYSDEELARFGVTRAVVADPPPALPAELPMYRVKVVLAQQGLTAAVTAFIAGLAEPEKTIAQILWDAAPNLVVEGPLATQVRTALSLTDEQYAALIAAAVSLDL